MLRARLAAAAAEDEDEDDDDSDDVGDAPSLLFGMAAAASVSGGGGAGPAPALAAAEEEDGTVHEDQLEEGVASYGADAFDDFEDDDFEEDEDEDEDEEDSEDSDAEDDEEDGEEDDPGAAGGYDGGGGGGGYSQQQPQLQLDPEVAAAMAAMNAENAAVNRGEYAGNSGRSPAVQRRAGNMGGPGGGEAERMERPKTGRVNFSRAKQVVRNAKMSKSSRRAKELANLVELDLVTINLFDMPPMSEYDMYIRSYGGSNCTQTGSQTGMDGAGK